MVVFIDESGTHKQVDHSIIVLVYVEVNLVDTFEKAVIKIEEKLKIRYFHWKDESWDIREEFINLLIDLDFSIKVAILENPIILSKSIEEALEHLVVESKIKKIVIDGKKPSWYSQRIKKVLRDKDISVKKVVTVRKEESEPGIRVADCMAGLIRYSFDNPKSNAVKLYKKLKKANKIKFELTLY